MNTLRIAACGFAFALTAGLAQAQNTTVPRADANSTGHVSLAEYQKSRDTFIMRADTDKDGKVTKAEWDTYTKAVRHDLDVGGVAHAEVVGQGTWWNALDANKDGVVTHAEVSAMTAANFHRYDLDGNGLISSAEAQHIRKAAEAAMK